MSGNRFVISDTHFSHTNSWAKFKLADGSPLRPFSSDEEMDEAMVDRWNAKVREQDTTYHLGDVAIAKRGLKYISRLNGRKILIAGNHDIFKNRDYIEAGFAEIRGCRVFVDRFIMTHIPLHPDCVTDRFRVNVHGHLHANQVMRQSGVPELRHLQEPDPRYLCVSVEQQNYEPLSFDELDSKIQTRWKDYNYVPPTGSGWGNGSAG